MSLTNDYHMYYVETYVAFTKPDGTKAPMYVTDVRWINGEPDDPWDNNNVHELKFRGHVLEKSRDGNVRIQDNQVWKEFDEIDFDIPDLGYFLPSGFDRPIWLAMLPARSAKKGFTLRKTNQGRNLETRDAYRIIWEAYNSTKTYAQRHFHLDGRNIEYKGIRIGQYEQDMETLRNVIRGMNPNAEYLREMLEEMFNANQQSVAA